VVSRSALRASLPHDTDPPLTGDRGPDLADMGGDAGIIGAPDEPQSLSVPQRSPIAGAIEVVLAKLLS
jgi:hypothetical protein